MTVRLVVGLLVTVVALGVAAYRVGWLARLVWAGRAIPAERMLSLGGEIRAQLTDVFAQRKLFKRPVSGWAHAITFWAFLVLLLTIIEAYGALFQRDFAIPVIGRSAALGLIEDIFAVGVLAALVVFTAIRLRQSPKRLDRKSRFYGSHVDQAYIVLAMIFGVIATLLLQVQFDVAVQTNSMSLQKQLVRHGHGWTILPGAGAATDVAGTLSAAPLSEPEVWRSIVVGAPRSGLVMPAAQAVASHLTRQVQVAASRDAWPSAELQYTSGKTRRSAS